MNENQSRTAFEAWASGNGKWQGIVGRYPDGDYMVAKTQERWEAWQACAEAMNQPNQKKEQEMNEQKFDPTKPVMTRDGRKVRIIAIDRNDTYYPIVALVSAKRGEGVVCYGIDGKGDCREDDLVNVVPSLWQNVYKLGIYSPMYEDRECADAFAAVGRAAVLELPQDGRKPILHDVGGAE